MKYNISDIKKKSTQIKNNEGTLAAVDFVRNFIASTKIELFELLSLLDKLIPYAIKEKSISEEEILEYVNQRINKFPVKDDIEKIIKIADTLSRINIKYGIEYFVPKIDKDDTPYTRNPMYFDALIQLSDFYLDMKESDKAFQTISRAVQLVPSIQDKFESVKKWKMLAQKSAEICLKRKKPQYADFLHYYLVDYILDIALELTHFPNHGRFYGIRKWYLNGVGGNKWYENNKDFINALESLKIHSRKDELLRDVYDYMFNQLISDMGLEKKWFDNINDNEQFRELQQQLNMKEYIALGEDFKNKSFDGIHLVHDFVSEVVKKYYDMEN